MFKVVFVTDSWATGEKQFKTLAGAKRFELRLLNNHAGITTSIVEVRYDSHVSVYKLHQMALAVKASPEHSWLMSA